MKIPKKIKIVGFDWEVINDKSNKDVVNEGNCWGSTHHSSQKIFIDVDTTQQKQEQVFFHEVLHALWRQMGIGKRKDINNYLEEEIVDPLSNGLYQVLKDNNLLK